MSKRLSQIDKEFIFDNYQRMRYVDIAQILGGAESTVCRVLFKAGKRKAQRIHNLDEIMEFIINFALEHGCLPTLREIGDGCGISSTSVVAYNLEVLEGAGRIQMSSQSRAYKVTGLRYVYEGDQQ